VIVLASIEGQRCRAVIAWLVTSSATASTSERPTAAKAVLFGRNALRGLTFCWLKLTDTGEQVANALEGGDQNPLSL
jgi:hypothetical protein